MGDIQIVPATHAHLQAILDQTRVTFEEHRSRNPKAFPEKAYLKLKRRHKDALQFGETAPLCFVATVDGALCGYILLHPIFDSGMVYDIGVFSEFRRKRIGLSLVEHGLKVANNRQWDVLFASVWDGNEASHGLFRTAGFTGRRSRFFAWLSPKGRTTPYIYDLRTNDPPH